MPDVLEFTDQPPEEIVQGLARRGRRHCALLGGGEVYRLFVEAGLVDTLWLSIEPVLLGGGTPLLDGPVGEKSFDLFEVRHLSQNTLLLNYTRRGGLPRPLPPP